MNQINKHFSLSNLREPAPTTITEALIRAQRLVSPKTGIISQVELEPLLPGEPNITFA